MFVVAVSRAGDPYTRQHRPLHARGDPSREQRDVGFVDLPGEERYPALDRDHRGETGRPIEHGHRPVEVERYVVLVELRVHTVLPRVSGVGRAVVEELCVELSLLASRRDAHAPRHVARDENEEAGPVQRCQVLLWVVL